MSKNIITVFGATGAQGGSVVDIFLNDPKLKNDWAVRGVTRDVSKDSAKALASKGVEVVAADMDDKESLARAMKGASAVFAVTNYWDKADMAIEIQQGKNLADAAKETGVHHYIWSSLLNVSEVSNGALQHVYHFDGKAQVEDYVRGLGIPASFFLPGMYMSNFPGGMFRQSPQHGDAWVISLPFPEDRPISLFATAEDTGKYVKAMVLKRDRVLGERILAASDEITGRQMLEGFAGVYPEAGKQAQWFQPSFDMFKSFMPGPEYVKEEFLENMRLIGEYGYYGGASLEESKAILEDPLTTWEEFVRKAPAFAGLK